MTNRRDLLFTGLGLAAVAGGWQAWINREKPFEFVEVEGLPGWRRVESGAVTRPGGATFLTIAQGSQRTTPLSPDELARVLYGETDKPGLAVFSDFFCPYCRLLTQRLSTRPDLAITWHELPLLGPPSEIAAQAAIAADMQNGYAPFISALGEGTFRPTTAHMGRVADGIGLNGRRLMADMQGEQVNKRLTQSRRAASTLGIYGTPGLTLGRTLVIGNISVEDIERLRTLESA